MKRLITNSIKEIVLKFEAPELQPGYIQTRKAGIWQGIDSYKDMDMFVIRDVDFEMDIPSDIYPLHLLTSSDHPWAEIHFQERISGNPTNPGESYKKWPYAQFKEANDAFKKIDDDKFDHTYMERFWPKYVGNNTFFNVFALAGDNKMPNKGLRFDLGDYNDVVNQLKENPLTRQAFLPIFFPEDTGAKNNMRVPCTIGYHFEIWDGKLDMTYYIRSCDILRHFRNDVYMAGRLIQHTSKLLFQYGMEDIKPGKLMMKIANLHLFENDLYAFKQKEKKIRLWRESQGMNTL